MLINRAPFEPGSAFREPPSVAYAAFSPPLQYPTKPGQAKCSDCFIGGNFWDLRATGLRVGNSSASQAQGSPVNAEKLIAVKKSEGYGLQPVRNGQNIEGFSP
jgi:cytochrome c peroxidase